MARIVVIGAGPMGLAAAYQAVKDGHEVDVLEAAPEPGGMAGHFDFGGISLERFYHFVCRSDGPTFELLDDLGISNKLRWVSTTMGFFFAGRLNRWGDPFALLRLRGTSMITKLRYGLFAFICTHRKNWPALETMSAKLWIRQWCGPRGYEDFWRTLFDYKFYEHSDDISAAWIWTRIRRIGLSRKNLMQEELGYFEGGSKTLMDALVEAIEARGGRLHLNAAVEHVEVRGGAVTGVRTRQGVLRADHVISTVPIPRVSQMIPALPQALRDQYDAIKNIGICCVILKLKRSVSPHFWINISGMDNNEIPGVIEFSNLRQVGPTIVYVPYYMPTTNEKFSWSDEELLADSLRCLTTINPAVSRDDLLDYKVSRLRHAQPICEPGFKAKIPPVQTPIRGLQIADTCFYYPEDRGIAESVRLGRQMARSVTQPVMTERVSIEPDMPVVLSER